MLTQGSQLHLIFACKAEDEVQLRDRRNFKWGIN